LFKRERRCIDINARIQLSIIREASSFAATLLDARTIDIDIDTQRTFRCAPKLQVTSFNDNIAQLFIASSARRNFPVRISLLTQRLAFVPPSFEFFGRRVVRLENLHI
jgi:hypothetical protein